MSWAGGGDRPKTGGGLRVAARRFAADERGATSIEYAMIAGLIFIIALGSLRAFSTKVVNVYAQIGNAISQAN